MVKQLQAIRGTKDVYPAEYRYYRKVEEAANRIGQLYGFEGMGMPVVESIEVFKRTLGTESDVVGKEMYVFEDKGGEQVCLRPEFTAGMVRAFITSGLTQQVPLKLYTTGPLFRYERPQKGRQRQFHQINFEVIGASGPETDVELIAMGAHILRELSLTSLVTLEINSLGDEVSREAYRSALVAYFEQYRSELSEDSQVRLVRNPLRILDSKDDGDKKFIMDAPKIDDYYTPEAKEFFARVLRGLEVLNIAYKVNPSLVRGLDYYCHTAFEFTTTALGSQNAVLAGGRYDALVEMMGGPSMPSVGFAGGIERLVGLLEQVVPSLPLIKPVVVAPIGREAEEMALCITQQLRQQEIYTELLMQGAFKKRMKKANQKQASYVLIIGEEELKQHVVLCKNMEHGTQENISIDQLATYLRKQNKQVQT